MTTLSTPDAPAVEASGTETVLMQHTRLFAAICAAAAGVFHVVAALDHAGHHPTLGRAFLLAATFQIAWAVLLVRALGHLVVAAGLAGTVAAIGVWVVSRATGIPWFPGLVDVEPIGWRDLTTQLFQVLSAAGAVLLLLPARVHRPATTDQVAAGPVAAMAFAVMLLAALVYGTTHGYVHDAETGPTSHGHETP